MPQHAGLLILYLVELLVRCWEHCQPPETANHKTSTMCGSAESDRTRYAGLSSLFLLGCRTHEQYKAASTCIFTLRRTPGQSAPTKEGILEEMGYEGVQVSLGVPAAPLWGLIRPEAVP